MNNGTIPSHAVVRRIDDLGRIAINRELRKQLRIGEGNPLAMWTENGQIRIAKFQEVQTIAEIAGDWALAFVKNLDKECGILVTDRDEIVVSKTGYKFVHKHDLGFQGCLISDEVRAVIERGVSDISHIHDEPTLKKRAFWINKSGTPHYFESNGSLIVPILNNSDVIGTVVLYNPYLNLTENEVILTKMLAVMIASSLEETR